MKIDNICQMSITEFVISVETNLMTKKMSNRERWLWEKKKQNMTLSQEEPEQIGSFKNSLWEIPACSSRKLQVNGTAKVPAERSGLIPLLDRSFSNMPRFSLPPWATASDGGDRHLTTPNHSSVMVSIKDLRLQVVWTCDMLSPISGGKLK